MSSSNNPTVFKAMSRGLHHRCPRCGEGQLFWRYLKVSPACPSCQHDLAQYPADDGPAYFTILLVGHMLIAPLLLVPAIWEVTPLITVPATLIPLAVLTLVILPRIKGAFIGYMFAMGVKAQDQGLHTADAAE